MNRLKKCVVGLLALLCFALLLTDAEASRRNSNRRGGLFSNRRNQQNHRRVNNNFFLNSPTSSFFGGTDVVATQRGFRNGRSGTFLHLSNGGVRFIAD